MADLPVVIITATIMDGLVVRWYLSQRTAEQYDETVSASRNGVLVNGYLHEVQAGVLETAHHVYETLRDRRPNDWVRTLATHRRHLRGGVEPARAPSEPGGGDA